nr:hypothetical protein Iba_chr01aCG17840 [Ipomoea batatas]
MAIFGAVEDSSQGRAEEDYCIVEKAVPIHFRQAFREFLGKHALRTQPAQSAPNYGSSVPFSAMNKKAHLQTGSKKLKKLVTDMEKTLREMQCTSQVLAEPKVYGFLELVLKQRKEPSSIIELHSKALNRLHFLRTVPLVAPCSNRIGVWLKISRMPKIWQAQRDPEWKASYGSAMLGFLVQRFVTHVGPHRKSCPHLLRSYRHKPHVKTLAGIWFLISWRGCRAKHILSASMDGQLVNRRPFLLVLAEFDAKSFLLLPFRRAPDFNEGGCYFQEFTSDTAFSPGLSSYGIPLWRCFTRGSQPVNAVVASLANRFSTPNAVLRPTKCGGIRRHFLGGPPPTQHNHLTELFSSAFTSSRSTLGQLRLGWFGTVGAVAFVAMLDCIPGSLLHLFALSASLAVDPVSLACSSELWATGSKKSSSELAMGTLLRGAHHRSDGGIKYVCSKLGIPRFATEVKSVPFLLGRLSVCLNFLEDKWPRYLAQPEPIIRAAMRTRAEPPTSLQLHSIDEQGKPSNHLLKQYAYGPGNQGSTDCLSRNKLFTLESE